MKKDLPQLIQALTPLLLAMFGVGMTVFGMTSRVDEAKFNTASNIAFTLVGGAAGAVQGNRSRKSEEPTP